MCIDIYFSSYITQWEYHSYVVIVNVFFACTTWNYLYRYTLIDDKKLENKILLILIIQLFTDI